jgi:pimeloyl-ACP methyl ester carboxylesterase
MTMSLLNRPGRAPAALVVLLLTLVPFSAKAAASASIVPKLDWTDCDDGFQCATARVPLDYNRPHGKKIELALIRKPASDPAHRIGHLFFHQGGSGQNIAAIRAIPPPAFGLFSRFDFIGFDQRGVGHSKPAVVPCGANPAFGPPYPTPQAINERAFLQDMQRYARDCEKANRELLPHLSSANSARDLELLRIAVGDDKLTYLGASFGTTVGATYASLFPGRARAMLLDSAMDVSQYLRRPVADWREYSGGHEEALKRFLDACAADRIGCGFGGNNPGDALDKFIARLEDQPLPSSDPAAPGILTADHVRMAIASALRRRILWPVLATGLAAAEAGDPSVLLSLSGTNVSADTASDAYLTALYAVDQDYPRLPPKAYFKTAARAYQASPHFWTWSSYTNLVHAYWPVEDRAAFRGQIRNPSYATPALVIGMTHDPATPYAAAQALTADLGNARLLTFDADGHFAVGALDPCVLGHAIAYLEDQMLPPKGTVCVQQGEAFPVSTKGSDLRSLEGLHWELPASGLRSLPRR